MLRLGILGAGFMGSTHAAAFHQAPGVRIAGISSRSLDKAAAVAGKYGAQPYDDALRLATDPNIDIVSNTLPTHMHKELTLAALAAGKHVLLEKPMALTLEDCDEIIAAAQSSGRILMIGQTLRFWPEYVALVDFVKSGALGAPLAARAIRLAGPPRWADFFLHPELSGGEVLDLHIHDLDALNWLFGAPVSVYSRGQRSAESGGWDLALTLVDYGQVGGYAEGSAMQNPEFPFTMGLYVLCEGGAVEYHFRAGGVQVDSRGSAGTHLTVFEKGHDPRPLDFQPGDAYANEAAAFVDAVTKGSPPENGTPEQGRLAVATALAARESLESGKVVLL
jgi:predicted dehydrogenase